MRLFLLGNQVITSKYIIMNNKPEYQSLSNRPIACTFCGAHVDGRIVESVDQRTKKVEKNIRWQCGRCGNLVRQGKVA